MMIRRIENIRDVQIIYSSIQMGIVEKSFTDIDMMDTLRLISSSKIQFFILENNNNVVAFGSIKDKYEIHKVYVVPIYRNKGYGKTITLWLADRIIKKNKVIPTEWIKSANTKWNKAQKELGMVMDDKDSYCDVNRYNLVNLEKYVEAYKKYKISDIQVKKYTKPESFRYEYRYDSE
jgi:GNAT superfamily N-acetyltransferase